MILNNGPLLDDFWDGTAGGYDRWYSAPQGAMYDLLEKRAAAWALRGGRQPSATSMAGAEPAIGPVSPAPDESQTPATAAGSGRGKTLLEVGCGTGRWSAWLAAQGYDVTGLDRSPGMLEVARQRQLRLEAQGGAGQLRLMEGDACSLPVADGSFDVAMSVATLDYLGDGPEGRGQAERAVAEMVRTLRRGGRIIIGVFNRLAPLNIWRQTDGGPPWDGARMFTPRTLAELLAPHGAPSVRTTAWLPDDDRLLSVAPAMDYQYWKAGREDGLMLFGWADVGR